jgi:DNA-binding LacI/PurR family transcriptional regulator
VAVDSSRQKAQGRRTVRLKDIAERAGVSIKTASNALNGLPHVRESTRERVLALADELGYRPNLSARGLKTGRTGFVAVAIPELSSPYFAELASRLARRADQLGYIALFDETGASADAEQVVLDGVSAHLIDGILFSPLALTSEQISARRDSVPMVLLGERSIPHGFDHVAVDSVAAARAMTEHLISTGRRRIAAIGRKSALGTHSMRLTGYREALRANGIRYDARLVHSVDDYTREQGLLAMRDLLSLRHPPEAVFCFNDLMAVGALRAIHEAGLRVPHDIAVAGFDDIAETQFTNPPLTTIAPDLDVLADQALQLVLARIGGDAGPARDLQVPWRLIVRESTGQASATR